MQNTPMNPPLDRGDLIYLLHNAGDIEWSIQGIGMMRTYFGDDKEWRLNVWDQRLAVPGVSTIHDHPWHFDSMCVGGVVINNRFDKVPMMRVPDSQCYGFMRIKCGPGGGPAGCGMRDGVTGLTRLKPEVILTGETYHQDAHEVHESMPLCGTVTLNKRVRLPDSEHAKVFWPLSSKWVDAEPRAANPGEVQPIARDALRKWF